MGSVSTTAPETDLTLIMDGGENFLKRMAALQTEKKALQEARDNLHLAIDLKRSMDAVAEARAALERDTITAKREVTDARAQARAEAADIRAQAAKERQDAIGYAGQTRGEADAYASKIRADASAVERATKAAADAAAAAQQEVEGRRRALEAHKAALDDTAAKLKSAEAAHKEKVAMLGDVLSKLA